MQVFTTVLLDTQSIISPAKSKRLSSLSCKNLEKKGSQSLGSHLFQRLKSKETHISEYCKIPGCLKNLLKTDIIRQHLLNTYSLQDALYMLFLLHTVKIEAWRLMNILHGETEN